MSPKKSLQKYWRTGLAIIAVFAGACTPQEVVATPSPSSFPTSTQILKTNTPPFTQTLTPTATATATPTIDVVTALASEFDVPVLCLPGSMYLISKDQNWIGVDCKFQRKLIIANKSTGSKTVIPFFELDKEAPDYFSTRPLSWSSNNQYFYFTTRCCEPYEASNQNGSLYRFDTAKETWDIFIHAVYDPYYFFSDNGDHLVYINHYPFENTISVVQYIEIGMIEISSNKSKRIVLTGYYVSQASSYIWSKSDDEFTIILNNPILSEMRTEEVALRIDFKKMDMWLVEEFSGINLLVNE